MSNTKANQNGTGKLPNELEQMRLQVIDLELKARYWKAQHDIRHFTLEAEKLQPEYDKYLAEQKVKQEEALEEFKKQMEELKAKTQPADEPVQ